MEVPLALAKHSLSLSPNRLKPGNKKRKKKKKKSEEPTSEEPTRLPPDPHPPHPANPFSLSPLFLPFVFRGSCCNSADHQQLPFQQYLTLPNPRPSLHPDTANAHPASSPPKPTRSHREAGQAKALLLLFFRNMFTE